MSENADALATVFRDKSPWCNYEPSHMFSAKSILASRRIGNTVYLHGNRQYESKLHYLVDTPGSRFVKQYGVCSCNAYKCANIMKKTNCIPRMCVSKDMVSLSESECVPNDLRSALSTIECLIIASRTGNTVELKEVDLSSLTNLRSLHIEKRCFLFAKRFVIHDLRRLESIRIDRFCFVVQYNTIVPGSLLSIKNCSELESIHIESGCFNSYSSMELGGKR